MRCSPRVAVCVCVCVCVCVWLCTATAPALPTLINKAERNSDGQSTADTEPLGQLIEDWPHPATAPDVPAPAAARDSLPKLTCSDDGRSFTLLLPPELKGTSITIQEVYVAIQNHGEAAVLSVHAPGTEGLLEHVAGALASSTSLARPCPATSVQPGEHSSVRVPIPPIDSPAVLMEPSSVQRRTGNRLVPLTYDAAEAAFTSTRLYSVPALTKSGRNIAAPVGAGDSFLIGENDVTEYKLSYHSVARYILPLLANLACDSSATAASEAHICLGVRDDGTVVGCHDELSPPVGRTLLREACKVRRHTVYALCPRACHSRPSMSHRY